MEECELGGLSEQPSLNCRNVLENSILQVTSAEVRIVESDSFLLKATWKPPANTSITLADISNSMLVLALSGGRVVVLSFSAGLFDVFLVYVFP